MSKMNGCTGRGDALERRAGGLYVSGIEVGAEQRAAGRDCGKEQGGMSAEAERAIDGDVARSWPQRCEDRGGEDGNVGIGAGHEGRSSCGLTPTPALPRSTGGGGRGSNKSRCPSKVLVLYDEAWA